MVERSRQKNAGVWGNPSDRNCVVDATPGKRRKSGRRDPGRRTAELGCDENRLNKPNPRTPAVSPSGAASFDHEIRWGRRPIVVGESRT